VKSITKYVREPGRIWRKMKWARLYKGPRHDVTVDSWNGRLTFDSRDRFIGKYLSVDGAYEPATITNALGWLEKNGWLTRDLSGVLVDIGANIGMITTAMLTQGWFGRAVCFEPLPGNVRLQRMNIAQNALADRVTSLAVALSSQPGELALEISETNTGDNRIRLPGSPATAPGAYQEEKRAEIRVPVETLDGALAKAGIAAKDVRLIWMDIQGHEEKCLEGASATLAAGMPVCMEFWPYGLARAGTTRESFMRLIAKHFTKAYRVLDDGVVPLTMAEVTALFDEVSHPHKMTQLLLVKEKR
jgi:FkbM family methyltransferase